jgi:ATP-binding cassette, subfamily F, member 3
MLTVHHLSKSFNLQTLFENVTFSLNPGERLGLIGPNGCGKTTLLRILAGEQPADTGHVRRDPDLRIGYLPQGFEPDPGLTLGELIERAAGAGAALEAELIETAAALAQRQSDLRLQRAYDDLLRRITAADRSRVADVLARLGLADLPLEMPIRHLSGGQITRLSLALVILQDPQLLLLDEPTNHLDIAMLEWLEGWLVASPCAVLIVSHDRTFLDHVVTGILDMDPHKHTVREYPGNYSAYLEQRQAEIEKQWTDFKDQQLEIRQMRQDIARTRAQAAQTEREASSIRIGGPDMKLKGFKDYQRSIAKKVARKARAREKKLERYLESDERVEKPGQTWHMKLEFSPTQPLGRRAILLEQLSVGYQSDAPLLVNLNLELRGRQRVVLTGPNGSGKTTLLRTIAGHIPPLQGEVRLGAGVHLGFMTQDQSNLDPGQTALETIQPYFLNETQARSFLAYYLFTGDEPLKLNALLSYGQRARLMLAKLAAEGCNCLLLDEPINHLDIPSRTQFEQALSGFEGAVLAVVHDRYFIERFADSIWHVYGKTVNY